MHSANLPHADPAGATPGAEHAWYLNEYTTDRRYGGPEEGGWWYETGHFEHCHGTFANRDDALTALTEHQAWLRAKRAHLHPIDSVLCTGWPDLRVQNHPGTDYPTQRPHYQ